MKTMRTEKVYSLYTVEEANRVAATLQENDPDWSYRPVHDPSGEGYSYIEIYDEAGEYVSRVK